MGLVVHSFAQVVLGVLRRRVDAKWERQEAANAADRRSGLMDTATPLWSVSK